MEIQTIKKQNTAGAPPLPAAKQSPAGQNASDPEISILAEADAALEQTHAGQIILDVAAAKAESLPQTPEKTDQAELESTQEANKEPTKPIDNRLWDAILTWRQNSQLSIEENLEELQQLFLLLQKEILATGKGGKQLQLLAQLDELMLDALTQLLKERNQELLLFFAQYGMPDSDTQLLLALFEKLTGRSPFGSPDVAALTFGLFPSLQGKQPTPAPNRTGRGELPSRQMPLPLSAQRTGHGNVFPKPVGGQSGYPKNTAQDTAQEYGRPRANSAHQSSFYKTTPACLEQNPSPPGHLSGQGLKGGANGQAGQGLIYQKASHGIQLNTNYLKNVARSEQDDSQAASRILGLLKTKAGSHRFPDSGISPHDLEAAQNLVRCLRQGLPAISQKQLLYTSEEYMGLSAGIFALKSQVFIEQSGIGPRMTALLKYAVDSCIQEYFLQNSLGAKQALSRGENFRLPFQADDIQKIYHYMLKTYAGKKDAQTSALKGLQEAYENYQAKQKDPAYEKAARYRPDVGFFSRAEKSMAEKSGLERELLNGWKNIARDWNSFLQSAKLPMQKALRFDDRLDRNFVLALLLSQEAKPYGLPGKRRKAARHAMVWDILLVILIAGIVVLFLVVTAFL